jgi:hypothetical protein
MAEECYDKFHKYFLPYMPELMMPKLMTPKMQHPKHRTKSLRIDIVSKLVASSLQEQNPHTVRAEI